jgi:hypothetical protein
LPEGPRFYPVPPPLNLNNVLYIFSFLCYKGLSFYSGKVFFSFIFEGYSAGIWISWFIFIASDEDSAII